MCPKSSRSTGSRTAFLPRPVASRSSTDWMVDDGQTLPLYENPNEAYEGNPLMEKYPLQLSQTRSKFFVHEQFVDAAWIQQFYMTTLEMNEEDAKARGLANDDIVRGFNDRGEFKCKVRINNAIRPARCAPWKASGPSSWHLAPAPCKTSPMIAAMNVRSGSTRRPSHRSTTR